MKKTQTHSSADRLPTDTPPKGISHSPSHQREKKPHLFPLECRYKSLQIRSLPKPLDQSQPPRAETKRKNYDLKSGERRLQTSKLEEKNEKTEKYCTNEGASSKLK